MMVDKMVIRMVVRGYGGQGRMPVRDGPVSAGRADKGSVVSVQDKR
jgi:hypothetical protein